MEYRKLPHGEERISIIGMGASVIGEHPRKVSVAAAIDAVRSGVMDSLSRPIIVR